MTCFNDCETSHPFLEIVDNEQNSLAKALTLKVHPPMIGVFPLVRKSLDSPIHLTKWSTTEMKDIKFNFSSKVTTESDVDVFEDCITSLNPINMAKNPHLPLDEVKGQVTNESPSTKLTFPSSENVELSEPNLATDAEEGANQIRCSNTSKDLSSESLKLLEKGVSLILKGLWEVIIIDLSPLEVLLEDFFKRGDYDAVRLSTSQKITRDSHQELLSAIQQRLHTVNEEKIKADKHLGELQKVLARAKKKARGLDF
ncbi:hypothetical protein HAX54_015580 [Datura stramonium]|uniref:Uncharacterized protein n=1 Tax=Datura stramonium TaxID=4076 RepID=A0ABS8RHN6_DATST|nr:hypothetical protein [Datura stramonium]